jgi:glycosyltransferase involved in cell wall biosynthesis
MAVRLFAKTGRRLCVVGDGPEYSNLKSIARPNIEFRGRVPDAELRDLYSRCRAFILPGEEDFGITPVEALASGKAVIALGQGGALETVPPEDRLGGFFFREPEEEQLEQAIARFEKVELRLSPQDLQASVTRFSETEFLSRMSQVLNQPRPTSRPYLAAPPVSCASES